MTEAPEERSPMYVHCADCGHEWVALYLLAMDAKGMRLLKAVGKTPCLMCASRNVLVGRNTTKAAQETMQMATEKSITERANSWIAGGDTGVSSKAIWSVMMGNGNEVRSRSYPRDPDDFGRCARLLHLIPEWRQRISSMADLHPVWGALSTNWEAITKSMDEECGIDWSKARSAPKTYALMKSIIDPAEKTDTNIVRLGGGMSISIGDE